MNIKNIFLFLLCFSFLNLLAQEDENEETILNFEDIDPKNSKLKKTFQFSFGALDYGFSTLLSDEGSFNLPDEISFMDLRFWRSGSVSFHLVDIMLGLSGKDKIQKLGLHSGIRLYGVYYSFENDFTLADEQETFESAITFVPEEIKKHRLMSTYLAVPLMLEYNSKPWDKNNSFKLGFGYVYNFRLYSNSKLKYENKEKMKVWDDFNLNPNLGMAELRIGYGPIAIYVQYGLDGLFVEEKGPNVVPFNFGFITTN